jgi:hypothetical protein
MVRIVQYTLCSCDGCPHTVDRGDSWCRTHKCRKCASRSRETGGPFCNRHACGHKQGGRFTCDLPSHKDSRFCKQHTCSGGVSYCKAHVDAHQINCYSHSCAETGCRSWVDDEAECCTHHSCRAATGCTSQRIAGGDYCSQDTCSYPAAGGCKALKVSGSTCCSLHTCAECSRPVHRDFHLCIEHSCAEAGCREPAQRPRIYCRSHTCGKSLCNNFVPLEVDLCADHACARSGCLQPAKTVKEYCSVHSCALCSRPVEPGVRLCVDHACARTGCVQPAKGVKGYCSVHSCAKCNRPVEPGVLLCEDHTCASTGCRRPHLRPKGYCYNHTCYVGGCTLLRVNTLNTLYCQLHACRAALCTNKATTASELCAVHTCDEEGCPIIAAAATGVCAQHMCQWPQGCTNHGRYLDGEARFCESHVCAQQHCYKKKVEERRWCSLHRCLSSTEECVGGAAKAGFCDAHVCRDADCRTDVPRLRDYCTEHTCATDKFVCTRYVGSSQRCCDDHCDRCGLLKVFDWCDYGRSNLCNDCTTLRLVKGFGAGVGILLVSAAIAPVTTFVCGLGGAGVFLLHKNGIYKTKHQIISEQ